ncbi:MAG TPA: hypothetical protein VHM02_06465, partial [Thermoanaerobaculia bacterium]|nr:hypothetical protein [Thermoanaerobaculia bacterium]
MAILAAIAAAGAACGGIDASGAVEVSDEEGRESEQTAVAPADDLAAARPVVGARVARALYPPAPGSGGGAVTATDDPLGFRRGADALDRLGFRGFFAHHFHPVAGERTLVELFAHPAFREVLARPEIELFVFTVRSLGPPVGLGALDGDPATLEPRLAEEGRQIHALALRLLDDPALAGKTVVLKFWESDWLLVRPSRVEGHAEAARALAFVEWMRARQEAVARARAERPVSPVRVLHAVEVNRVHDGLPRADGAPGLLRAVHLLPRIAPDAVAYSAWDSLNPPR